MSLNGFQRAKFVQSNKRAKKEKVMKVAAIFIVTLICGLISLIPEAALYLVYHLMSPTTETGRIVTGGLMIWFGGGFCLLFAAGAFFLWVGLMKMVLN